MSIISYAQNLEDVLLWRALGHVKDGFYIDVGASDPVEDSVTKLFYDAGWRGINVEPLPSQVEAFARERPRDINLAVAAGAADGELVLYDVPDVRGWASPERAVADAHVAEGHALAELTVPVRTLSSICAEHVDGEVHFLKIDVEGFEEQVLRGMDLRRWRPWLLMIEATLPNSRITNHQSWEHLVTEQDYRYAWFDGLNRYYVAAEHAALLEHLALQPNVFDDYVPWAQHKLWDKLYFAKADLAAERDILGAVRENLESVRADAGRLAQQLADAHQAHADAERVALQQAAAAQQARAEAAQASADAEHTRAEAERLAQQLADTRQILASNDAWAKDLEQKLIATYNSRSWKITRPLRAGTDLGRALRRPHLARRVVQRLTANQALRRLLIPLMLRYPALGKRVTGTLAGIKQAGIAQAEPIQAGAIAVPDELKDLPLSVRAVLADLERVRSNDLEAQH
jgi:FkbM family methyltransferase